jgi:hypothetical protein
MAAQVEPGDPLAAEGPQGVGQCLLVGQIGDGDLGALAGEPAGRLHPAPEVAQPHDRHSLTTVLHNAK